MSFEKIESALLALMEGKTQTVVEQSPNAAQVIEEKYSSDIVCRVGHNYSVDWDGPSKAKVIGKNADGIMFRRINDNGSVKVGDEHVIHVPHEEVEGFVHNELHEETKTDTDGFVDGNNESSTQGEHIAGVDTKDTALSEGQKEESEGGAEEAKEGEAADQVQDEPAVTVDNPIDPTLNPSQGESDAPAAGDSEEGESNKDDTEDKKKVEESLSDEFKEAAEKIFEAKVEEKANQLLEEKTIELEKKYEEKLNESVQSIETKLFDKINEYFGVLSEQWMKDNELALEASIKSELTESFIYGMKRLFESHYIDLPVEKYDIVNSLEEQLATSREKLESAEKLLEDTTFKLEKAQRDIIMENATKGMTEIDASKLRTLMEDFEFGSDLNFVKRVEHIKESFFSGNQASASISDKKLDISTETLVEEKKVEQAKPTSEVSVYSDFIKRNSKK